MKARKGYSLIEKENDYNINIHLAFASYKKAFILIEHFVIIKYLDNSRLDSRYSVLLMSIYKAISCLYTKQ